jgi:HAD superfamily hydrolase (TIGR01490 family)
MASEPIDAQGRPSSPPGELASDGVGEAGAAFFDLDRTLMQGSSAFQFARAVYRAGLISRRQLIADAVANIRFRLQGSTDDASVALRERIAAGLEGRRVVELERLGADVLAGILPRVYPQMLALAHQHQDAGRRAYIVTAASKELADILARVMAFDGAVGSDISEVADGVYTGRPTGVFVYRSGKPEAMRQLAAREGIDLSASYAYSDSESDLPMLQAVGHPVAVNPDATLARIARERGWQVLRLDRLGRRLKATAALGVTAGAAGAGGVAVLRRIQARHPLPAALRRGRRVRAPRFRRAGRRGRPGSSGHR